MTISDRDNVGIEAVDFTMSTLGITHMAYIRPVINGFAVCAADGTQLAIFATQEAAYFSARQYNLEPLSIH